jgi:hypothetical protein
LGTPSTCRRDDEPAAAEMAVEVVAARSQVTASNPADNLQLAWTGSAQHTMRYRRVALAEEE